MLYPNMILKLNHILPLDNLQTSCNRIKSPRFGGHIKPQSLCKSLWFSATLVNPNLKVLSRYTDGPLGGKATKSCDFQGPAVGILWGVQVGPVYGYYWTYFF